MMYAGKFIGREGLSRPKNNPGDSYTFRGYRPAKSKQSPGVAGTVCAWRGLYANFGGMKFAYCTLLHPIYSQGIVSLIGANMNHLWKTHEFAAWVEEITDPIALAKIAERLYRAERGNFGDSKPVGEGVSEMRIDYGPGYRLYYARDAAVVYFLLVGGNKSTQERDIALAKRIWTARKVQKANEAKSKKRKGGCA